VDRQASLKLLGQENTFDGTLEDISFKGLKIHSLQEINNDSNVTLHIALDDSAYLDAEASVVWSKPEAEGHVYGLHFTSIRDQDKDVMYAFVRKSFSDQVRQKLWMGIN
jgi:hypothetical protein